VPQIDVYDPDLDTWVESFGIKPHDGDWPGRALGDFACAWGNTIWCLAGTEITENYPYLQPSHFGFFANETDLGYVPIPDPRCYAELETIGDYLYVVGGCRALTASPTAISACGWGTGRAIPTDASLRQRLPGQKHASPVLQRSTPSLPAP
jgi:hypothetical protein